MTTDRSIPEPCDEDIFRNGKPIAFLSGRSQAIETWVVAVAAKANVRLDWHYSGGVAQVLYLGTDAERAASIAVIRQMVPEEAVTVLRVLTEDAPGLYRKGITEVPENTVAAYYDGGDTSAYMKEAGGASRLVEQRNGITFLECLETCLHTDEMVRQWERLSGKRLVATHQLDRMIDEATGYDLAMMQEFADFVYEYVFCTFDE